MLGIPLIFAWLTMVQATACTAPSAPALVAPTASQINVSRTPTFSWSDVGTTNCPVNYVISVGDPSQNCSSLPPLSGSAVTTTSFSIPSIFALESSTNYKWCVQAVNQNDSTLLSSFQSGLFSTRSTIVPVPSNLQIFPATSISQASGSSIAVISAQNGEEGSIAHLYLHQLSGDTEVGSVVIGNDPAGSFSLATDVTMSNASSGERDYYIKIERPADAFSSVSNFGLPSATVKFFYDSSLRLQAPVLSSNGATGSIKWASVPQATLYKVWRRVGLGTCTESSFSSTQQTNNQACFLVTKPFTWIQDVPSVAGTTTYTFTDPNPPNPISAAGVSYFVTAENSATSSRRSNAVSFGDTQGPVRSTNNDQFSFIPLNTGTDSVAFFCGLDPAGFFGGDNSPDLYAHVYYLVRPVDASNNLLSCPSDLASYSVASALNVRLPFDALNGSDYSQYSEFNCIQTGKLTHLQPSTSYCYYACLEDSGLLEESNCSTQATGFKTPTDTAPPDFAGLKTITGLASGTGIQVGWDLADEDASSSDVVHYEIQVTNQLDSSSVPVFNSSTPKQVLTGGSTTATFEGLQTGTQYCFQASVLDSAGNRNTPPNAWLCAYTLDNRPYTPSIFVLPSADLTNEAYKIRLQFQIIDRLAGSSGLSVGLDSLQYRIGSGNWVTIDPAQLSGANLAQLPFTNSTSTAPLITLTFDTLPYFAGQQNNLEFQMKTIDSNRLESTWSNSGQQTVFQGMSTIGEFDHQNISSCSLHASDGSSDPRDWILLLIIALAAWTLRLSIQRSGTEK